MTERGIVFSTSVEVFLDHVVAHAQIHGLLHVRGGVSSLREFAGPPKASSPRPWRCFSSELNGEKTDLVFSTSVEVFPPRIRTAWMCFCLLHVRGGVSGQHEAARRPHPVFSTSVEVFPRPRKSAAKIARLLHVRGGVSKPSRHKKMDRESSLRPWRCFLGHRSCVDGSESLLHVRGGVSFACILN